MFKSTPTFDWMLVTVRGFDQNKGYIYGNRHPDGKPITIAKNHSVSRNWVASMSDNKLNTFTPPQSVIAIFSAEVKDEKTGFTVARWATPISKNLGQEDVFVTPIKVSNKPKKIINQSKRPAKNTYVDAIVLDEAGVEVRTLEDVRSSAISALTGQSKVSLGLDGQRGFMIRIGSKGPDGNIQANSWEFFGRKENRAEQTWNFHWNRKPQDGKQHNLIQAVLTASSAAFLNVNSYVEVVGLTRVLVNDFGSDKRVSELAELANYKTTINNSTLPTYSLAAISVQKHGGKRIIKQQIPLPRNKVVNHLAGVLGNHVPGFQMPVRITPLVTQQPSQTRTGNIATSSQPHRPTQSKELFPLQIENYVNQTGEVNSFRVIGTKESLERYSYRIESAARNIEPFRVKGNLAYSFPLKYRNEVEANLYDLAGTPAIYVEKVNVGQKNYLGIGGMTSTQPFKAGLEAMYKSIGTYETDGTYLIAENKQAALISAVSKILNVPDSKIIAQVNVATKSFNTNTGPSNAAEKPPVIKPVRSSRRTRPSFSQWLQTKFGKDPYAILEYLDNDIAPFSAEAGIDWSSARDAVVFSSAGQKGQTIKTSAVRPFDKGHKGSVAMAAHFFEKNSTTSKDPGESIVWFKLVFMNLKAQSGKVNYSDKVTYDAYPALKEEYDRETQNGVILDSKPVDLEAIKKVSGERKARGLQQIAEQEKKDQNSRDDWARKIPTMAKEDGTLDYLQKKNVAHLINDIDLRRGNDNNGAFCVFSLHDMDHNFTGAQRIYEKYLTDKKGKKSNKFFIQGTQFKDEKTDLYFGTHCLVGEINLSNPIIFCEGLADSGTLRAATGLPVAVCLNKDNLYNVVGLYRQRYPNTRLIIASDNDAYNKKKGNVGFAASLSAANDHNCEYVIPSFEGYDKVTTPKDFNDLESLVGIDTVRGQLKNVKVPPSDLFDYHKLMTGVIGLGRLEKYLDDAVKEVVKTGIHGCDETTTFRQLVVRATLAYGYDDVKNTLGDRIAIFDKDLPTKDSVADTKRSAFPVECCERKNLATGKSYTLIKDHEGGRNKEMIESSLRNICGSNHRPYNEHLEGWVAPFPIIKLLNSYLSEKTGAPELYIGKSRAKRSGPLFVVRGNFTDDEFRDNIEKLIRFANPIYRASEYGFIIPDSKSVPYVKETLKSHLRPSVNIKNELLQPDSTIPNLNSSRLDEAVRFTGLKRSKIVLAHYALQFNNDFNIFLDNDFVFSSVYARSNEALSNLEGSVLHQKALEDACRKVRTTLKTEVGSSVVSDSTLNRLEQIVTHLEFIFQHGDKNNLVLNELTKTENNAIGLVSDKNELTPELTTAIVFGNKMDLDSQKRESILLLYQQSLVDGRDADISMEKTVLQTELSTKILEIPEMLTKTQSATSPGSDDNVQFERAKQLIEITRLAVEKGFDDEELYDLFITQNGSPYFDKALNGFRDDEFRRDLIYLSSTDKIEGWKATSISTTSSLYYAIYNSVAKERLKQLEQYVDNYLGANGATTYKTFSKYFSGQQLLSIDVKHPYIMEGEVNNELIERDLEYQTEFTSLLKFYDSSKKLFEKSQPTNEQEELFGNNNSQNKGNKTDMVAGEIIVEVSEGSLMGEIKEYSLADMSVYSIELSTYEEGSRRPKYYAFNLDKDVSTKWLHNGMKILSEGNSISIGNIQLPSRGSVSISNISREDLINEKLDLNEVDYGPATFYYISHETKTASVPDVAKRMLYIDYQTARKHFQELYRENSVRFPSIPDKITVGEQASILKMENPTVSKSDIGQRFKEWANSGEPFDNVLHKLDAEYGISFDKNKLVDINIQYESLVERAKSKDELRVQQPDSRYDMLYEITSDMAGKEMSFDEYSDDFFRPDGHLVEANPYWDENAERVDRKQAFDDINAAGYRTLSQFYESIFESLHHRKSSELIVQRTGGYIPSIFDDTQPLRPQFSNLENLFPTDLDDDQISKLPLFKEWVESLEAYSALHPILVEDLSTISNTELSDKYNRDALLLVADIHGVSIDHEMSVKDIATKTIQKWKTRFSMSEMTHSEIIELDETAITDTLVELGIPSSGKKKEKGERLIDHLEQLKAISRLRIAQYSYIKAATKYEKNGKELPHYVVRGITEFISNENSFKNSAHKGILRASIAKWRCDIESAFNIIAGIPAIVRSSFDSVNKDSPTLIGTNKSDYVTLGKYKYLTSSKMSSTNIKLPDYISYYAQFSDRVFSTPVALDNDYLGSEGIKPISGDALLSCVNSLEKWMQDFGYAGFHTDDNNNVLLAYRSGKKWVLGDYNNGEIITGKTYSNVRGLLENSIERITGFADRDVVVESWLQSCESKYGKLLAKLSLFTGREILDGKTADENVEKFLKNKNIEPLVSNFKAESKSTQLDIALDKIKQLIHETVWKSAGSDDARALTDLSTTSKDIAALLDATFPTIVKQIDTNINLWQVSPSEAIERFQEYSNSEKHDHQLMFNMLEKKYYSNQPESVKHAIALSISSGEYESLGHYLHECSLKEAFETNKPEAKSLLQRFYPELNDILDADIEIETLGNDSRRVGDNVLVVESVDGEHYFGSIAEINPDQFKISQGVLTSPSVDTFELSTMERKRLFGSDNIYLPSLSLSEFRDRPESMMAYVHYFDIDPRTSDGYDQLTKLKRSELSDFAETLGSSSNGDRVEILNSIKTIVFARKYAQTFLSDGSHALTEEELTKLHQTMGLNNNSLLAAQNIQDWIDKESNSVALKLSERNYSEIQKIARANRLPTMFKQVDGKVKLRIINPLECEIFSVSDLSLPENSANNLSSFKEIQELITSKLNEKKIQGYMHLTNLGITSSEYNSLVIKIPTGYNLKPLSEDGRVAWAPVGTKGEIFEDLSMNDIHIAVDGLKNLMTEEAHIQEDHKIAWEENGELRIGHMVANEDVLKDKHTLVYTDKNRKYVSEINKVDCLHVNENELSKCFIAQLSEISGHRDTIESIFIGKVETTLRDGNKIELVQALYIEKLAERLCEDISKNNDSLPSGYDVYLENLRYRAVAIDEQPEIIIDQETSFESPAELVRNVIIQQRIESKTEVQDERVKPTESVGTISAEPHGKNAPSENGVTEEAEQVRDNIVRFPTENKSKHGDYDKPPNEPRGSTRNKQLHKSDKLSPENSNDRRRAGFASSSPRTRGVTFHLPSELESLVSGSPTKRIQNNLAALRVRKMLIDEVRLATTEEKSKLLLYSGWGGLHSVFNSHGHNSNTSELLTLLQYGEFKLLKNSVLSAFYTPPSIASAVWKTVEHLGFEGGKILDPSTGTGNYIGSAPPEIARTSSFIGKEIEPVSASIAQYCFGEKSVHLEAFEKARLPNNYFDLAISNIPFGDFSVFDPDYKKNKFLIHDFFFAKSLDKVKTGGLVAFITSTGTLDKKDPTARKYLSERADLIGAIRLPRNTFRSYSGTYVNADIIFLQKRLPNVKPLNDNWVWSLKQSMDLIGQEKAENIYVNRYFVDHPEMIIGEQAVVNGRYGPELVTSYDGELSISSEIESRIKHFPKLTIQPNLVDDEASINIDNSLSNNKLANKLELLKPGNFVSSGKSIGVVEPVFVEADGVYENRIKPINVRGNASERIVSMVALRDKTKEIINLQLKPYESTRLVELQRSLGNMYELFVDSFGALNNKTNSRLFRSDPDSPLILALEKYNLKSGIAEKTDIFTKATIRNATVPSSADSSLEALHISLGVSGKIDTKYISSLMKKPWPVVLDDLDKSVYLDPESQEWQTREQYLSGNIREKIDFAVSANLIDSQFERNINALTEVLPLPVPAYDIKAHLGAVWVPKEDISHFIKYIVAGNQQVKSINEKYAVSQFSANWVVIVDRHQLQKNEGRVTQDWGTSRINAVELIDKILNNRQIVVKDKADGVAHVNRDETIAANQKADLIRQEFKNWLWNDPQRSERLASIYNNQYNVFVEPKYTGKGVSLHGITPTLKGKNLVPRSSQLSAIQRYLLEGRSLNAHPVGSGKTLELVGSAMEGKRLGIHKKALIVVPNNVLSQFGRMALELYPSANVLTLEPKQLAKDARKLFTARIATGDWDMVVIAQSSFNKISTPIEHQMAVIEDEKYALEEALQGFDNTENPAEKMTVKRLVKNLDKLEKRVDSLTDSSSKDNLLFLNEIGVDALFVDEADNYLNLHTPTQMGHIPGVNTSSSQQAMNMFMAVRFVQELNGDNRGIVFATGTDVRNSMSDMYTMLRYLAPDILQAADASNFDSFMSTFGEVVKTIEIKPEGTGYRENARLSKFTNIPEMVMMYRQVADVLTNEELNLPRPTVKTLNIAANSSEWLVMYMSQLAERAINVRNRAVSNREDNLLKISGAGRKASLDMRLINPNIPDDPGSKVNLCVANVMREWDAGKSERLTQVIFCDQGTPKKEQFNIYDDIKTKLIANGVPEKEIAFSQSYKTQIKKKELEDQLNKGDIRVVIASTETLGVGSNIQERLVAEHNLDAPWRPRDLEQRGGRMVRPGNTNEQTTRYIYSTVDSFDLFLWETLKRKASFIKQAKTEPQNAAREIEEEVAPTYSEIMAITTGNPLIREKIGIDSQVEKLEISERTHKKSQWKGQIRIKELRASIDRNQELSSERSLLIDAMISKSKLLVIDGVEYTNLKKAGTAISSMVKQSSSSTIANSIRSITLGSFGDASLDLSYKPECERWVLRVGVNEPFQVSDYKSINKMLLALIEFPDFLGRINRFSLDEIAEKQEAIESLEKSLETAFAQSGDLNEALRKQAEINHDLASAANKDLESADNIVNNFDDEVEKLTIRAPGMRYG